MRRELRLILVAFSVLYACTTAPLDTGEPVVLDDAWSAGAATTDGGRGGRIGPGIGGDGTGGDGTGGDGTGDDGTGDDGTGDGGAPGPPANDGPPSVVQLVGAATAANCLSPAGDEDVTHLVDGDLDTKFLAFSSSSSAVFDAGAPYVLTRYALISANDAPERDPVRWLLQGSNDAQAWHVVDIQVDQRFMSRSERHAHSVAPGGFFRWYRLRMENAGGPLLQVAEFELFGTTVFVAPAGAVPTAPSSLRAEPVSRTQIDLDWLDASDDEVVFRIERADDGTRFAVVGQVPAGVNRFRVAGLEPGGRASYRVVAENAAGASPPSEPLVATPLPALVGRPGGGGLTYSDAGYTLRIVDDAPGVTPPHVIAAMVEEFFLTYPRMVAQYNPAAPRAVTVQFDPSYGGVAEAAGDHIRISSSYAADHPDDIDVIVHECFHLVQAYRFDNVPGWAVEGLADYVRWEYGTRNAGACWTMQRYEPGQSYTDAYGVTARFFLWLVTEEAPDIMRDLDATLRQGSYDDGFWIAQTGRTVDQLWADYVGAPAHEPVSYE